MDAVERKRNRDMADAMDTPDAAPASQEKRFRADDLRLALVRAGEIVKDYAQRWAPR